MKRHMLFLATLVGLWACSEEYFPDAPDLSTKAEPVAAKVAPGTFQLDPEFDYDPFNELDDDARKAAIGGITDATVYLKLITVQLAKALQNETARGIIHENIPLWSDGEIKIAQTAIEHPALLTALAQGFKQAVSNKTMSNQLANRVQASQFDEKAILQVAEAMFDLEITLVNPSGQTWNGSGAIPVFFIPVDDKAATVITGVDTNLDSIALDKNFTFEELPYSFLSLNFDEDSPEPNLSSSNLGQDNVKIFSVWDFFVSTAYAHHPSGHAGCHHNNTIQNVREITLYDDHEDPASNLPEIFIKVYYENNTVNEDPRWPLPNVNYENTVYTEYDYLRTRHGICAGNLKKIEIIEDDLWVDDLVAGWSNISFPSANVKTLTATDARLRVKRTQDSSNW